MPVDTSSPILGHVIRTMLVIEEPPHASSVIPVGKEASHRAPCYLRKCKSPQAGAALFVCRIGFNPRFYLRAFPQPEF
jgi:hypothetical protein